MQIGRRREDKEEQMLIKSFGAAKNVTGSCHLLTDDKDGAIDD